MNTQQSSVAAILVAAGKGLRFTSQENVKPKQFLLLRNKPVYFWSLHPLVEHPLISSVILVVPQELESNVKSELANLFNDQNGVAKVFLCCGGQTRQESVLRGLEHLERGVASVTGTGNSSNKADNVTPDFVLIHDACRPFLNTATIESVINHVTTSGACTVATPVSDTIKKVKNGIILDTFARQELLAVQTPQAGPYNDLLKAHRRAVIENFATTDDAALLEWAGFKVQAIPGNSYNLKITQPLDLIICEALADYL